MAILIGDLDPLVLYKELSRTDLTSSKIIEAENQLTHLYEHNLILGAKCLRLPTALLSSENLSFEYYEIICNIALGKARQAAANKDVLVAGVISQPKIKLDYYDYYKELIVLLDDLGVDFLLLDKFNDLKLAQQAILLALKLSNLSLAVFYETNSSQTLGAKELDFLGALADDYQLELIGLSGDITAINQLKRLPTSSPKGIILNGINSAEVDLRGINSIYGGSLKRSQWQTFTTNNLINVD